MDVNLFLNKLGPFKKHHLQTFEFPIEEYLEEINRLISIWFNKYCNYREDFRATTKWIINKFISTVALSHFKNWIYTAKVLAPQRIIPYSKYYKFVEMPFFAFVFPDSIDDRLEYYKEVENNLNKIHFHDIVCPFNEQRASSYEMNFNNEYHTFVGKNQEIGYLSQSTPNQY
ncbi:MAG: hypothetical protein WD469_02905 [Paenibacillaceae bacterium]